MNIGLVTDSTCDLSSEIITQYNIEIVPLNVHIEDEVFTDGLDIDTDEFYRRQKEAREIPSTSQPSVGKFMEKYRDLAEKYDRIISIHLSGELSGTLDSARLAALQLESDVDLFDSRGASLGLGLQVVLAARMIEKGSSVSEIMATLKKAREKTSIYFTVGELTYLQAGGRIGKAQALVGSILNFNPILELSTEDGKIDFHSKVRGTKKTRQKMVQLIEEKISSTSDPVWLGFINGKAGQVYEDFRQEVSTLSNEKTEIFQANLGPVLGSHAGPLVYGCVIVKGDFLI
ncbi:MAG: DegV family protein [Bacillota bacterium]